jgi:23S rRNA (cytidine1920-2'-O)/16S rRNA (cytidine1409-2'-O)-methyltransferase
MPTSPKTRLDLLLVQKKLVDSRQRARALIMSGSVWVNQVPTDKPGTPVAEDAVIEVKTSNLAYVSRGGIKLEAALRAFAVEAENRICLDVGASTGGFSDCLLQNGARRVYAVDVGYGQLAWKLRQDPRVVVIERTNIRYLQEHRIPDAIDLVTIDVSFISLRLVVPSVLSFLKRNGVILALIKPQFEVGKGQVGKGGVVRNVHLHQTVIQDLTLFFTDLGLRCSTVVPSPLLGPKGNREFLIRLDLS